VSSGIDIYNQSSIPFTVSVYKDGKLHEVGTCKGVHTSRNVRRLESKPSLVVQDGKVSKRSTRFGIPVELVESFRNDYEKKTDSMLALTFSPAIPSQHDGWQLIGGMKLRLKESDFRGVRANAVSERYEITCTPTSYLSADARAPRDMYSFVFQACVSMTLANGKDPSIDVFIEPRALIRNMLPINVTIKTPMPHVFSTSEVLEDSTHGIEQDGCIEIFTPGPSIAIMVKCDLPVGGTATDWIEGGWVDLPLDSSFRMHEPLHCMFPYVQKATDSSPQGVTRGVEFMIAEGSSVLSRSSSSSPDIALGDTRAQGESVELTAPPSADDDWSTFFITVHNYAIDHIGDVLFEQVAKGAATLSARASIVPTKSSPAMGAFASGRYRGRVSILPGSLSPIRLLHLSMEGDEGVRRSLPFRIDDISICEGGVDSTPVKWEDDTYSGFWLYRRLVNSYQSEIHVVPEVKTKTQ
jgi:hypothetical protein